MVAEGLRQLQQQGVGLGLDQITLETAYMAADIPRSSSHSAWAIDAGHSPQITFQRAVLKAWLLERESSLFADAAQAALVELFADPNVQPTASAIVRTAIHGAFEAGFGLSDGVERNVGDYLSTDLALRYAIASQPGDRRDDEIMGWLRTGEVANRQDRIEDSYKPLAELIGMRPKAEYGETAYVLFGVVVASLVEGIGLRNRILPEMNLDKPLIPTPAGEPLAMLIGLCVEAIVPVFFELVPGSE